MRLLHGRAPDQGECALSLSLLAGKRQPIQNATQVAATRVAGDDTHGRYADMVRLPKDLFQQVEEMLSELRYRIPSVIALIHGS